MLPETPHPPSAPRARLATPDATPLRRGSDQAARAASPAPAPAMPLARPDKAAWHWPLPVVAAVLALCAAGLAAATAWLLGALFSLPPAWAAAAGAALALLVSAVPTLAVALARASQAGPAQAPADNAPLRDRDTGAFRRDMFMELAEREWARARRYGTGAGLLVVDLDRAAALLESHGAAAADAFLTALTRQTSPTLRGADIITRLAPTQLGVFLAHADATGALDVAERIRERAELLDLPWPAPAGGQAVSLRASVSVGVAPLRPAHLNLQALVHDAEDAVAAARLAGGNCVRAAPVEDDASALPGAWRSDQRTRPQ